MTEATTQIPGNPGAGAPRGETIKLSLAAGMCWALAMLGLYAQPQLAVWSLVTGGICLVLVTGALRRFEARRTGATSS